MRQWDKSFNRSLKKKPNKKKLGIPIQYHEYVLILWCSIILVSITCELLSLPHVRDTYVSLFEQHVASGFFFPV